METIIIVAIVAVVGYFVYREYNSDTVSVPASEPVVADKNNNGIVSKAELGKLTKVQLFDYAEKHSIKVKKSGNKAAVINEIHSSLRK